MYLRNKNTSRGRKKKKDKLLRSTNDYQVLRWSPRKSMFLIKKPAWEHFNPL